MYDVWNKASIVHMTGVMPGWELNSYSYDSRPWWVIGYHMTGGPMAFADRVLSTAREYHSDPTSNPEVIEQVIRMLTGY